MKTMLKIAMAAAVVAGANVQAIPGAGLVKSGYNKVKAAIWSPYVLGVEKTNNYTVISEKINAEIKAINADIDGLDKKADVYKTNLDALNASKKTLRDLETGLEKKAGKVFDFGLQAPKKTSLAALAIGGLTGYLVSGKMKSNSKISAGIGAVVGLASAYVARFIASRKIPAKLPNRKPLVNPWTMG